MELRQCDRRLAQECRNIRVVCHRCQVGKGSAAAPAPKTMKLAVNRHSAKTCRLNYEANEFHRATIVVRCKSKEKNQRTKPEKHPKNT